MLLNKCLQSLILYSLISSSGACWERLPLFDDRQKPSESDSTQDWLAVWGTGSDNIWIAGTNSRVFRWTRMNWEDESIPISSEHGASALNGVTGDANYVWLISQKGGLLDGGLISTKKQTESQWTNMTQAIGAWGNVYIDMRGIWKHDSSNIWIAGRCGCDMCIVDTPNGKSGNQKIANNVLVPFYQYKNLGPCSIDVSNQDPSLVFDHVNGIWGINENNIWAVGSHGLWEQASRGRIFRWLGLGADLGWQSQSTEIKEPLYAIYGFSASDIWAVGGEGTMAHWDGSSWITEQHGDKNLNAIWGHSATNIWAVGDGGTILHFDGSSWKQQPSPTENNLRGVYGSGPHDVWIVGDKGTVLMRVP